MSHACALVLIDETEGIGGRRAFDTDGAGNVESQVAELMEPGNEERGQDGWWDWYQIGGRFTGTFDGYDPEKDPENAERCDTCGGTGKRPGGLQQFGPEWVKQMNGCNGCKGTGQRTKWPTRFKTHSGDIQPIHVVLGFIAASKEGVPCYTMVSRDKTIHRRVWDGHDFLETSDFEQQAMEMLQAHQGRVVVVDYHS
jgi:hypothetical protein